MYVLGTHTRALQQSKENAVQYPAEAAMRDQADTMRAHFLTWCRQAVANIPCHTATVRYHLDSISKAVSDLLVLRRN